jgi:hypothetical protein
VDAACLQANEGVLSAERFMPDINAVSPLPKSAHMMLLLMLFVAAVDAVPAAVVDVVAAAVVDAVAAAVVDAVAVLLQIREEVVKREREWREGEKTSTLLVLV